jgi:hypothetical protein
MFKKRNSKTDAYMSCCVIVVDEISMAGHIDIYKLDAFFAKVHEETELPFGGMSVVLTGDHSQLVPVKKLPLFKKTDLGRNNMKGYRLYLLVSTSNTICLSRIMRSKNDAYIKLQEHVREGIWSDDTLRALNSRFLAAIVPVNQDEENAQNPEAHYCPTIVTSNATRQILYEVHMATLSDTFNQQSKERPIILIAQISTYSNQAKRRKHVAPLQQVERTYLDTLPDSHFDRMPIAFFLYRGANVLITQNIGVPYGLANGTRGIVLAWQFPTGTTFRAICYHGVQVQLPSAPVECVFVRVTNVKLKKKAHNQPQNLPPNTVCLPNITVRVTDGIDVPAHISHRKKMFVQLTQIPLRQALVLTSYNVQGNQFNQYIIAETTPKQFYIQMSRGQHGIESFTLKRELTRSFASQAKPNDFLVAELERLQALHVQTKARIQEESRGSAQCGKQEEEKKDHKRFIPSPASPNPEPSKRPRARKSLRPPSAPPTTSSPPAPSQPPAHVPDRALTTRKNKRKKPDLNVDFSLDSSSSKTLSDTKANDGNGSDDDLCNPAQTKKNDQHRSYSDHMAAQEAHHHSQLQALGLPAIPDPRFNLPLQYRGLTMKLRIVDYLFGAQQGSKWIADWATCIGFNVSIGNSASFRQDGVECGAVAASAAFQLLGAGDNFMTTDTSSAVSWDSVRSQYEWLETQDSNGSIEYNTLTMPAGHLRPSQYSADRSYQTWFLTGEEVSYLYMRASSPALNEHKRLPNVHMVRFNLRYDTRNVITSRELLHQLDINETLISTVTTLMESTFPPGATIYSSRPVRLKVLTTKLTTTGHIELSVSCAVELSKACSLTALQQYLQNIQFEVIERVPSTPTDVRFSPYYFTHFFEPNAETALVPNFPIIANRAYVQREIAKAMRKVATQPTGSQERRIAISNTDPHGGGVHWFTVCFEITKTH